MPVLRRTSSISPARAAETSSNSKSPIKNNNVTEGTVTSPSTTNGTKKNMPKRRKQVDASQPKISDLFTRKRPRDEDGEAEEKENIDLMRNSKMRKDDENKNIAEEPTTPPNADSKMDFNKTKDDEVVLQDISDKNIKDEKGEQVEEDRKDGINGKDVEATPQEAEKKKDISKEDSKCVHCGQSSDDPNTQFFPGHPQDAVEEYIALTSDRLMIEAEGDITDLPQVKLTEYSIYDQNGHLCSLDGGFIENDVVIYVSGYMKSIVSDSPDIDSDSVPVKEVGPIVEWYTHGFDGGSANMIVLCTAFGEYNLMKPSIEYMGLMRNLYEKISLSKVIVEYLEDYHHLEPSYEDLLDVIRGKTIPDIDHAEMTEEMLHKHAEFICDQVVHLEVKEDDEDPPLITTPCMRELIKLMGIRFGRKKRRGKIEYKKKSAPPAWTKATTTPLVRKTFETFFGNQLDAADKDLVVRRKRCGVCEACQLPDCGQCGACRAMAKFGGAGKTKKACVARICPNMAVEQAEESDTEDAEDAKLLDKPGQDLQDVAISVKLKTTLKTIEWIGEPIKTENNKMYFASAAIGDFKVGAGDFVMVEASRANIPAYVGKVSFVWKDSLTKLGYFHGQMYMRASETVLGEAADPSEVMLTDRCCTAIPLSSVIRIATVDHVKTPENWFDLGGKEVNSDTREDDGKTYYCKKFYENITARFEDLPDEPQCARDDRKHRFCPTCVRSGAKEDKNRPKVTDKIENSSHANRVEWTTLRWNDWDYKKGQGVFLKPGTFRFKNAAHSNASKTKTEKIDETIYTEYYRKSESMRGSNDDTGEPFCIGHILAILSRGDGILKNPNEITLKVNVLYRPENTKRKFPHHEDLNIVYWSDEVKEVAVSDLQGYCHLAYEKNITTVSDWSNLDPRRFYFREAYDAASEKFTEVPQAAIYVGSVGKAKEKGKGKGKAQKVAQPVKNCETEPVITPLRSLDVFAGCGGLSEGLHQAGIANCKWAIEFIEPAAKAYQLNNSDCTVFTDDCNSLLKDVITGASQNAKGLKLPMKGDVELLCGGPPCQGFSGMNRFNSREYSNFKNSLVATYLSYCDYYRPKYFILENVRNFVAFKRGMVLKLTLKCLLDMGYQCTFGIVQAGSYGVPQTRRRLIILASAPGYKLPLYPEPTHVFSRRACMLKVVIDNKKYSSNVFWQDSAPRRTCTIKDAMSDLPQILNGANKLEMEYGSMPESHFQRLMRGKDESLRLKDHICKNMAPLIQARIMRIPVIPGSDWRDLPNIAATLSDGTKSKVLMYRHHDKKNGCGPNGEQRGVCPCASGKPCNPSDKQENTLIPWCLPHTGNRHNNWAGLYGRIAWEGYFSTTVTDPEPMGKQGRILHPEQNRVVSVRECARSQGFPDHYKFSGSIQDKHRQIGNAVPPPLGAALGREIKKALIASPCQVNGGIVENTTKTEDKE